MPTTLLWPADVGSGRTTGSQAANSDWATDCGTGLSFQCRIDADRIMTRIPVIPNRPRCTLEFAPEVLDHLGAIEHKYHRLIEKTIDEQLAFVPEQETRNRKPLERPTAFGATWELRCGPKNCFRVFYEVKPLEQVVRILAIGVKERNRLFIGGEEIQI